jgi:inhibitor-of-growth protein 1
LRFKNPPVCLDVIENKTRQLDHDSQNLDFGRGDEDEEEEVKVKVKEEKVDKGGGGGGGGKRRKIKEEDSHHGKADGDNHKSTGTPTGKKMKKVTASTTAAVANTSTTASTTIHSGKKKGGGTGGSGGASGHAGVSGNSGRGNKQAPDRDGSASPPELSNVDIDPDEPTYCLCDQVSYGEMIGCDNDLCPIEWFHFNCVQLTGKPKGKWFCPKCRGDKPTVMKPKAQFLKELERFNKEKEEKLK